MPGLDAWIEGDGVCSYCGQSDCQCLPDEEEQEQDWQDDDDLESDEVGGVVNGK